MNKTLTELSFFAYDIFEELLESESFKKYKACFKQLNTQQEKMDDFIAAKKTYEDAINQYHKHSLELKTMRQTLSKAKQALYETVEAKAFLQAEKEVQHIVSEILDVVGETISASIQTPNHKKIGGSCAVHN